MTAEVIDGQMDLLELLGAAEDTPAPTASEIRGPGARILFHVRVGAVREDGTRYLTTAGRCGLCGKPVAPDDPAAGGLGTRDDATGDRWAFEYCGRCRRNYHFSPLLRYALDDGTFHLEIHEVPSGCNTCARRAHGDGISCGTHKVGAIYEHHVCSACGRAFTGHNGFADGRGVIGYGPVTGTYCSGPCLKPASELVRARYVELTNPTQED